VIADYRRDAPMMGPVEWREAREAFAWARELSPWDRGLRAKQLIAEAHLLRLAAQKEKGLSAATLAAERALARFREAAAADSGSFDPYLAMAVIQVYALADVDGAAASIDEAVKRGYTRTRREKALLGDGHMRRGVGTRTRAGVLTGDLRRSELLKARDDFEKCVGWFGQIIEFGLAAQNLERCKAQILSIDRQLGEEEDR
jgi:hypothetical protein